MEFTQAANALKFLLSAMISSCNIFSWLYDFITTSNIAAFILGIIAALIGEWIKRRSEAKDRLLYLYHQLQLTIPKTEQQSVFYSEFAETIRKDPLDDHLIKKKINPELENILVPDNGYMFNLFRKKLSIDGTDLYNTIFNKVRYISMNTSDMDNMYRYFKESVMELKKPYYELRREVLNDVSHEINRIKYNDVNYKANPFWNFLNTITLKYYENMPKDIPMIYVYDNLLWPLITGVLDNFRDIPEAVSIVEKANQAKEIRWSLDATAKAFADDFDSRTVLLENELKLLKEAVKKLSYIV